MSKTNELFIAPNFNLVDDFLLYEYSISMLMNKYHYSRDKIYSFLKETMGNSLLKERIKLNYFVQCQERPSWNKGIIGQKSHSFNVLFSQERKDNISKALMGRIGHKQTKETKEKISKTMSNIIKNNPIGKICKWKQGWFVSIKNSESYFYRSSFELDVLLYLEKAGNINYFETEPFSIKWKNENDEIRHYTPDLLVKTNENTYLCEIKPKYKLKDKVVKMKIIAAKEYCNNNNISFRIITEDNLKKLDFIFN